MGRPHYLLYASINVQLEVFKNVNPSTVAACPSLAVVPSKGPKNILLLPLKLTPETLAALKSLEPSLAADVETALAQQNPSATPSTPPKSS
jgi:hypothetical protein